MSVASNGEKSLKGARSFASRLLLWNYPIVSRANLQKVFHFVMRLHHKVEELGQGSSGGRLCFEQDMKSGRIAHKKI